MYKYKVKVSIKPDCENYDNYKRKIAEVLEMDGFEPLGDDEFGHDNAETSLGFVLALVKKVDWFVDNADELHWYMMNEDTGEYDEENALEIHINKQENKT